MRVWRPILAAIETAQGLDRQEGWRQLLACWQATSPDDHAQRCVLAHYLADLEPDLADEVRWDERALSAYAAMNDGDLAPIGIPSAAGFAPSLHLNLGDG